MSKKEFVFFSSGDYEDLSYLHKLLLINNIESELQETQADSGQMGLEEILVVLISSAIIPSILDVIKVWLENRKIEVTISNKNTGKEIHLTSSNGKIPDSMINTLESFLNE